MKLENLYTSKSLKNRLYLKKELFELKILEGSDVTGHIKKFNKCITQLLSVEIEIDEEYQAIILLASLLKSYETLVTTLLVGKQTLMVDEVTTALLETEKIKQPSSSSLAESHIVKEDNKTKSRRGRSKSRGRNGQNDRSKSCPKKDVECHYCHKRGHQTILP